MEYADIAGYFTSHLANAFQLTATPPDSLIGRMTRITSFDEKTGPFSTLTRIRTVSATKDSLTLTVDPSIIRLTYDRKEASVAEIAARESETGEMFNSIKKSQSTIYTIANFEFYVPDKSWAALAELPMISIEQQKHQQNSKRKIKTSPLWLALVPVQVVLV